MKAKTSQQNLDSTWVHTVPRPPPFELTRDFKVWLFTGWFHCLSPSSPVWLVLACLRAGGSLMTSWCCGCWWNTRLRAGHHHYYHCTQRGLAGALWAGERSQINTFLLMEVRSVAKPGSLVRPGVRKTKSHNWDVRWRTDTSSFWLHSNSLEVDSSHVNRKGRTPEHIRHDRNNDVVTASVNGLLVWEDSAE